MALDIPLPNIIAPQKVPLLKISDDVIACDLWFGPTPTKNHAYAYGDNGYLPPVTVTCDVIGQFHFWLFFWLEVNANYD